MLLMEGGTLRGEFVGDTETSSIDHIVTLIRDTKLEEADNLLTQSRFQYPQIDFSFVEMLLWAHQGNYHSAYMKGQELMLRNPDDSHLRFYMARIAVALGLWQEGLSLFDSIRGVGPFGGPFLTQKRPLWSRDSLIGKTVFLASEGGLGDAVCFARFASEFAALGAKVVMGGYEPMFPLLRSVPGVSVVVDNSVIDKIDFDYWIPALSCPRLLGVELNQIKGDPYMQCPPPLIEKWQHLVRAEKPKVALIWQGNESFAEDYLRSIAAEKFSKILSHSEFQFYSIRRLGDKNSYSHANMINIGEEINDPQDLAGFLVNMDLVISVDSGPAHLAGALGVPTILLNREMGWFTFGARPDKEYLQKCPWYKSMSMLHQKRWGQWDETLERAERILLSRIWPERTTFENKDLIYHPENPTPSKDMVQMTDTKYGTMLTLPNDFFVGKALEFYGEYSAEEEEIFRRNIKLGDHIVEVGAHIGALTLLFAQITGPQGSVLAFEPQEFLRNINRANMGIHGIKNVDVREEGLADFSRSIDEPQWDYGRVGNFGAVSFKESKSTGGAQIRLITLDSMNLQRVDFIKMDIEGMEVAALMGAEKTIQKFRPILFVENDRPEQAEELKALLLKWNYQIEIHHTNLFNPSNFKKQSMNIYSSAGSINILAKPL